MKTIKLTENVLKDSPVGIAIIKARDISKKWNIFSKRIEKCYIISSDGSELTIDPFKIKPILSALKSEPGFLEVFDEDLLSKINNWLKEKSRKIERSFELNLMKFCEDANITVEGRFPSYIIESFLRIEVLAQDNMCRIGGKTFKTLSIDSLAPKIREIVREEATRDFEKPMFLEDLFESYVRLSGIQKINIGEPVAIKSLFQELIFVKQPQKFKKLPTKVNFQEYTLDFFARDLAKLLKSGNNETQNGHRLMLMPTSFTTEGIPVLNEGSIRYIGRIAFQ
jgi:hypothetical protein